VPGLFFFFREMKSDKPVKSRHSRAGGNPYTHNQLKILDSRFHGNDEIEASATFYENIKSDTSDRIFTFEKI
jgi:hypothetical protein